MLIPIVLVIIGTVSFVASVVAVTESVAAQLSRNADAVLALEMALGARLQRWWR